MNHRSALINYTLYMGFERKSFIALFIILYLFTLPGRLPDSPSWPSGKLPGLGVFEKISKMHQNAPVHFTRMHQNSPVHSLIPFVAVPQKSKKRQAKSLVFVNLVATLRPFAREYVHIPNEFTQNIQIPSGEASGFTFRAFRDPSGTRCFEPWQTLQVCTRGG